MALITVTEAKLQLHRPDMADDDPLLLQLVEAAEAAIVNYLNRAEAGRTNTAAWTDPTTTPADVRHAVRLKVAEFERFLGDDLANETPAIDSGSGLSPTITSLLRRYSDPVLG